MIPHILHGERLLKQAKNHRRFWAVYTALMAASTTIYALVGLQPWLLAGLIVLGGYMVHVSHRSVKDRERFIAGMVGIYRAGGTK